MFVADETCEDTPEVAEVTEPAAPCTDDAPGMLLANEGVFGTEGKDGALGNDGTFGNDGTLGKGGILGNEGILGNFNPPTNPPILPTVFEEKSGFLTPAIIPPNPDGFGIEGFGKLGRLGNFGFGMFGTFTAGNFGIFAVGRLGAETFGILGRFGDGILGTVVAAGKFGTLGAVGKLGADNLGTGGALTAGMLGDGILACIPSGIVYSFNSPPSYPGDPPPPTVNTLVLIKVGNESLNATN